jgi:hypothetical protein
VINRYFSIEQGLDDRHHCHYHGKIRVDGDSEKSTSLEQGFFRRVAGVV